MKSFLFIALFLIISCETTEESNDVVNFYTCLLLDSDVVYKHINSLVDAILTLDPVKLVESFTTIYPAILSEVNRCKKEVKTNSDNDIVLKLRHTESVTTKSNTKVEFFKALLKVFTTYIAPSLKEWGFNIKKICNDNFPDVFICDLLE